MKLNIFTKSLIGMGLVCSALPALAMWKRGITNKVVINIRLFSMAKFMKMPGGFLSTNCPGRAKANDATNPWRLKRDRNSC